MKLSTTQSSFQLPKAKKRKGFSLVEVIIAIGIVALLLTGFLGVFGTAQRNINRSLGVKEANMLKDSLETEMSTLRSSEVGTYDSPFHKAFEMIKESTDSKKAVVLYQYKAMPVDNDDDGILPPFTGEDGIQGKNYLTQVAVRKKGVNTAIMKEELKVKNVVGNIYVVRMKQLVTDPANGNLELSSKDGAIYHIDAGASAEAANYKVYNKAVITFQAEFFRLPTNTFGYLNGDKWDFTKLGAPVAVINMAVRR